ncbi:MAG: N-acetylmuramoyl-L-alanine amidase [Coprococcus sp.]|jgi:N-acetylmuramoyl-L-alanine amidase CwlA
MGINIIKITGTNGTYVGDRGKEKYLVIHYTAGVTSRKGSARNTAEYFKTASGTADFIVDDEEIVQYNPDPNKYSCWAVGGDAYGNKGGRLHGVANNHNCISIEICSTNKTGRVTKANDGNWYFTEKAVSNAVKLAVYLMNKYNIPLSRVIRHYDVTGKYCPGIKGWNTDSGSDAAWQAFKNRLAAEAGTSGGSTQTPAPSAIKWAVTVTLLRIRKGPGTNYAWTGRYTGKGVFTIVERKNGWGRLKSGAGWISLSTEYGHRVG